MKLSGNNTKTIKGKECSKLLKLASGLEDYKDTAINIISDFEDSRGVGQVYVRFLGKPVVGGQDVVTISDGDNKKNVKINEGICKSFSGKKLNFGPFKKVFEGNDSNIKNLNVYDDTIKTIFETMPLTKANNITLASGQSGSGKTYLLLGVEQDKGLLYQAISDLLNKKDNVSSIKLRSLQIYKGFVYDSLITYPSKLYKKGTDTDTDTDTVTDTFTEIVKDPRSIKISGRDSDKNWLVSKNGNKNDIELLQDFGFSYLNDDDGDNLVNEDKKTPFTARLRFYVWDSDSISSVLKDITNITPKDRVFENQNTTSTFIRNDSGPFIPLDEAIKEKSTKGTIKDLKDFDLYYETIQSNRPTRSTSGNQESSRSHLFLYFDVTYLDSGSITNTVTFVDLAGNELSWQKGGQAAIEGDTINIELSVMTNLFKEYSDGLMFNTLDDNNKELIAKIVSKEKDNKKPVFLNDLKNNMGINELNDKSNYMRLYKPVTDMTKNINVIIKYNYNNKLSFAMYNLLNSVIYFFGKESYNGFSKSYEKLTDTVPKIQMFLCTHKRAEQKNFKETCQTTYSTLELGDRLVGLKSSHKRTNTGGAALGADTGGGALGTDTRAKKETGNNFLQDARKHLKSTDGTSTRNLLEFGKVNLNNTQYEKLQGVVNNMVNNPKFTPDMFTKALEIIKKNNYEIPSEGFSAFGKRRSFRQRRKYKSRRKRERSKPVKKLNRIHRRRSQIKSHKLRIKRVKDRSKLRKPLRRVKRRSQNSRRKTRKNNKIDRRKRRSVKVIKI